MVTFPLPVRTASRYTTCCLGFVCIFRFDSLLFTLNGITFFFSTMDGLQVSTDSDKFLHSRVDHDKQHYANSPGAGTAAGNTHEHTKANPGGLKPLTFGLLVAAVTCIVTAGLVGGIVGGVLGNRTSKSLVYFYFLRVEDSRLMSLKSQQVV